MVYLSPCLMSHNCWNLSPKKSDCDDNEKEELSQSDFLLLIDPKDDKDESDTSSLFIWDSKVFIEW